MKELGRNFARKGAKTFGVAVIAVSGSALPIRIHDALIEDFSAKEA